MGLRRAAKESIAIAVNFLPDRCNWPGAEAQVTNTFQKGQAT